MARTLNKLNNATVKAAGAGKYSDGGGLWIYKNANGGAKWVLRYSLYGRRHEMGLGGYPEVSLKEARESAEEWRLVVRKGKDAIKERERQRREAERNMHILNDVAIDAFESRKAELKDEGKAGNWFSPLELHVLPKLGKMPITQIDQRDIRDTLAPIWHTKASTAQKAIDRLGVCIKHAAALGLNVDMQATQKAKALLGKQRHTVKHIPAMAWQDVPQFYQSLNGGGVGELALQLLILTAARSANVRNLHEYHIDGDVWTIPADAMKGRMGATTDFRVPLSEEALRVIEEARKISRDGFLFPGVRRGVLSDMTLSAYMKRRGIEARPHGFRSSFRDWCAETTNTPREVAETALGHVSGSSVERSYRRTDYLEQRRTLMERWAKHLLKPRADVAQIA